MTITSSNLRKRIKRQFPNAYIELLDPEYKSIDRATFMLVNEGMYKFLARIWGIPVKEVKYIPGLFDCEDFAKAFDVYVNLRNVKGYFSGGGEAIPYAIGRMSYLIGGAWNRAHAIGLALIDDKLTPFEPQSRDDVNFLLELTPEEKGKTWFVSV